MNLSGEYAMLSLLDLDETRRRRSNPGGLAVQRWGEPRSSGEHRLLACSCRQLAGNIEQTFVQVAHASRQAAEMNSLAGCAPQKGTIERSSLWQI